MKKILFILLACVSSYAYSQIDSFDFGVIGGPGLSIQYGNYSLKSERAVAPRGTAGIFIQYTFNKYLSLAGDISFCQEGGNLRSGNTPAKDLYFAYHLNYLRVPLLLRFGGGNKVHVYGLAGPYVGIFLNGTGGRNGNFAGTVIENVYPIYYKRLDGGVSLGAGLSVPFAKRLAFICEVRNNVGLVNVDSQGNPGQINSTTKNYSCVFLVGASYKIGFKS